jgi:virginiamycin B lyase
VSSSRLTAALLALPLLLAASAGPGSAAAAEATPTAAPSLFSQRAASSRDAVTPYPMPRTLPTGGSGPLAVDHAGNVWFSGTIEEPGAPGEESRHPGEIARMNRAGEVTQVTKGNAGGLAVAPDGAIWFTGFQRVERIPPDGIAELFPIPEGETAAGGSFRTTVESAIVVGTEGDAWFGATRQPLDEEGREAGSERLIARMTPTGQLSEFVIPEAGGNQIRLAVGPEGNIWFTASTVDRVGYITPAGRIEEFAPLARYASPNFIAAGPDGAMWFTENEAGPVIARVTSTGALSGFRIGGEKEYIGEGPLVAGPDGRVWFAAEPGVIGRLDPDGRLSKIALPNHTSVADLVAGPEGEVWYSSAAEAPCLAGDAACGGAGYYVSGFIGRVTPAPLAVELVSAKPAKAGHQLKVRVNCLDGDASSVCRGPLRISAAGSKAKRRFSLGTDGSHTFAVALPKKARGKLLAKRRLAVRVEVGLAGGQPVARRFPLRIGGTKKRG